ncbi:hypothetical protein [Streptomyces celluloflavus]|uniref:hypothetical protein n=1 Tax=Streptomyces celluloflavus TaxID=58344 RepID=UPI003658BF69
MQSKDPERRSEINGGMVRVRRRITGAVGAGVVMLLAAGCAGAATGGKASPGASASVVAAEPLPLPPTPRAVTWTDSDHKAHPLRVTPTRLARGDAANLEHVRLDDDLKGMVPYYLTFSYTNTGKAPVSGVDPTGNFSVNGADGRAGQPVSLFRTNPLATSSGQPEECRESGRARLAAGETAALCQIFMLPKDRKVATVSYKDDGGDTFLWDIDGAAAEGNTAGVLPAGRPADSVTQDTYDHAVPVHLTPKGVRTGSLADLDRFDLSAETKKMVPYYVTIEYRNTGKYDLLPSMKDGVVLRSAGGQEAKKMLLLDIGGPGVGRCPESVPHGMVRPQATVTECSIHLLPKGDRPVTVVFQGKGQGAQPVVWRATGGDR